MFGLGMGEMVVIVVIAIVLFGTSDLPKNLRKAAKGLNEFKKVANDAQRQWNEVRDDVARTIMNADLEEKAREKAARVAALHAGETPPTDGTVASAGETPPVDGTVASVGETTGADPASVNVSAESASTSVDAAAIAAVTGSPSADAEPTPHEDVAVAAAGVAAAGVATAATEPPAIRPAEGTVARTPHEAAVDHSDPHHEERGTEPREAVAATGGVQKSS